MSEGLAVIDRVSIGQYLACRLIDLGVRNFFTVPGDFNMVLLDEMIKVPDLQFVGCCNELNAGYAADGYARGSGKIGVVVVTYMVGALSLINSVAGAFSDDIPVLVIVGSPNTNDLIARRPVHHSLGSGSLDQCSRCFEPLVAKVFAGHSVEEAPGAIDNAILLALRKKKPVYLEISCNIAHLQVPAPLRAHGPFQVLSRRSEQTSLESAIDEIRSKIDRSADVVMVAGSKLSSIECIDMFQQVAKELNCAVAVMPDAKGRISEIEENFAGCYWGTVSTQNAQQIVEGAKLLIFVGPVFNDYTTVGWSTNISVDKCITIAHDHVTIGLKRISFVSMQDVISGLAKHLPIRNKSLLRLEELRTHNCVQSHSISTVALTLHFIKHCLQRSIHNYSNIVVDTGESWFVGENLKLHRGNKFHIQMQYGSIGWSLPAMLGIGLHSKEIDSGKNLLIIGDGAFQVTCQELSTMVRQELNVTVLIIKNDIYSIEQQIHQGPYNELSSWDYSIFTEAMKGISENCKAFKVRACDEMEAALDFAVNHDGVFTLECSIGKDDCSEELKLWGKQVAVANRRT